MCHARRYILGPILAVLAIATFFGALLYLQLEKSTDIKRGMAGGGKQEGVVKPDPNRRVALIIRSDQTPIIPSVNTLHRTLNTKT